MASVRPTLDLGPVLQTSRVRVEPIGLDRARMLLGGVPEPGLAWERGFPLPPLLESLRKATDEPDGPVRFGPFFAYVIIRRSDGRAVGDIGFHGPPGPDGDVEVGYALAPAARGAGLASASVVLMARWAFAQPGVRTVSARVEPENAASVRLLERLGFELEGPSGDHLRYVLHSNARRRSAGQPERHAGRRH